MDAEETEGSMPTLLVLLGEIAFRGESLLGDVGAEVILDAFFLGDR